MAAQAATRGKDAERREERAEEAAGSVQRAGSMQSKALMAADGR